MKKLMSIRAALSMAKPVVFWAEAGTTLADVLRAAIPHMGEDSKPYEPLVKEYTCERFAEALVSAGFELAVIEAHDLGDYRNGAAWLDPESKADLEYALRNMEVPA